MSSLRVDYSALSPFLPLAAITDEHPRQVLMHSKIGGKRVVNMPVGEQLPRIC